MFTDSDRAQLARRGISEGEAVRQLEFLASAPGPTPVEGPCTLGDGIHRLERHEIEEAENAWAGAAAAGRFSKFVPASGAATRMFALLEGAGDSPRNDEERRFVGEFDRFAFAEEALARTGNADRTFRELVDAVLSPSGLGYRGFPKGAVLFHRYPDSGEPRTAFEEHLHEAAGYLGSTLQVHFTVAEPRNRQVEDLLDGVRPRVSRAHDVGVLTSLSHQRASTDTLALSEDGAPARHDDGTLLFRPSGHGALLENLGALDADLVYIRNIDNVVHADHQEEVTRWKRRLGGRIVVLERALDELSRSLQAARLTPQEVLGRLEALCAIRAPVTVRENEDSLRAWLVDRLSRPIRVCGVVENQGEPGGGPFWVGGSGGSRSGQIVEAGQMDRNDPAQRKALDAASHFNPVDLVVTLRARDGGRHELAAWVDPTTAFTARKAHGTAEIVALERPGLWNGAMAGWNTSFVEVPAPTFAPVKTVNDLLRSPHQPRD